MKSEWEVQKVMEAALCIAQADVSCTTCGCQSIDQGEMFEVATVLAWVLESDRPTGEVPSNPVLALLTEPQRRHVLAALYNDAYVSDALVVAEATP